MSMTCFRSLVLKVLFFLLNFVSSQTTPPTMDEGVLTTIKLSINIGVTLTNNNNNIPGMIPQVESREGREYATLPLPCVMWSD